MAKYYVITSGEYSAYQIEQITTDKKLAEAYVKLHDRGDMNIEEYDDLMDQCDIQDTFDKAGVLHPYIRINVSLRGVVESENSIKEKLENKNPCWFVWRDKLPEEPRIDEQSLWQHFKMWVQVDKYNYDCDKIIKVVMDTRAKMMAEAYHL